jgi:hypothetical protein
MPKWYIMEFKITLQFNIDKGKDNEEELGKD